jgi:hypothetical protein
MASGPVAALFMLAMPAGAASLDVQVRDLAGAPAPDAAIFAVPANPVPEARNRSMAIEQVDREFVPHVTVLQVGTAVAFGRIGAVLSAGVGSKMLDLGGHAYFFALMAGAMVVCFGSLTAVRRHIDRGGA